VQGISGTGSLRIGAAFFVSSAEQDLVHIDATYISPALMLSYAVIVLK